MKVAVVTGCSSGIGMHTAYALARDGYRIYATMRDTAKGGPVMETAQKEGLDVRVLPLDVTDMDTISSATETILKESGRIDVLVNNAGYGQMGTLEETPLIEHRQQFETNYFGVVAMIQAVLPTMRSQRSGRIVNIGSVAGRIGFPCSSPYIASKFAMEGLTESLRYELDGFGIQTTIIEPGVVKTPFFKSMKITEPKDQTYQKLVDHIMSGLQMMVHMGTSPEEVARVIQKAIDDEFMLPRYMAGQDAAMFMEARGTKTDAEFEAYMKKEIFPG